MPPPAIVEAAGLAGARDDSSQGAPPADGALSRAQVGICVVLIGAGALLRLAFVYRWSPLEDFLFSDMGGYAHQAQQLLAGKVTEEHFFQSIGYPVWVAALMRLAGGGYFLVKLASFAMSTLTFVLAWRAAARLMPERFGLVVLAAGAFHFPWIFFSGVLMAETPAALLLTALFYLLCANRFPWRPPVGLAIGALFAIAMLFKGTHALFAPLLFLWVAAWTWGNRGALASRRALWLAPGRALAAFAAGVALVLAAQAGVTLRYYGQVRLTAHAGALNFVEGKCPSKNNADSAGASWHSPLFVQLEELTIRKWPRPFTDSGYFWEQGWQCIADNPAVLLTSVRYVHYLFLDNQLWPANVSRWRMLTRWQQMAFAWLLLPGIVVCAIDLVRRWRDANTVPFLLAAAIAACVWFFKGEVRFRIPFDAVFLAMAMLGWMRIAPAVWPGIGTARVAAGGLLVAGSVGVLTAVGLAAG